MNRKALFWTLGFTALVVTALAIVAHRTILIDPFFHYHLPITEEYFYPLNNQRSMNNGIIRLFNYDGLITGTSMTENFKSSEANALWGCKFIKVPFSGGSFKEINDNVAVALRSNPHLRIIIRGLDNGMFAQEKDYMRKDLGKYPTYLYDNSIFNDVEYIFNRDVLFSRIFPMTTEKNKPGFKGGITSFDAYSNWMWNYKFGKNVLYPDGISVMELKPFEELTETVANTVRENIRQNVTSLAQQYPDVYFYYFFTPYSAKWWQEKYANGTLASQIQIERIVIEEILKCQNILLFSFNNLTNITTDLNNYKDSTHYAEWINSLILRYMHDGKCRLTNENYEQYLQKELSFYSTFDYTSMNDQDDYDDDYYAATLLADEIYDCQEIELASPRSSIHLSHAEIVDNQYGGKPGILCLGSLQRDYNSEVTVGDYMRDTDYCGFRFTIEDISPVQYITFYGKKINDHGQPTVYIYNSDCKKKKEKTAIYNNIDSEWHRYYLNSTGISGEATIIFNGGYTDNTGSLNSQYVFSDIKIYTIPST